MRTAKEVYQIYDQCKCSFYIYEEEIVKKQAETLKQALPEFEFLYSVKCNPMEEILETVFTRGFGADAASVQEVKLAGEKGLSREKILFSAPGRSYEELREVCEDALIIADSFHELELLEKIAEEKGRVLETGVRINPDYTMGGEKGVSSKFGMDEELIWERRGFFDSLKHIQITGIHVHLQSQVLSADVLSAYYRKVAELAVRCQEEMGWELKFLNFGGGLGIPYGPQDSPLDLVEVLKGWKKLGEEIRKQLSARLILESGRFLVCQAGTYYTPIVDRKESRGRKLLIVKNTLNGFLRPSMAEIVKDCRKDGEGFTCEPFYTGENSFDFRVVGKEGETEKETVDIYGSLCTAADAMKKEAVLPKSEIGDLLAVTNAGSYGYSLSPLRFSSPKAVREFYWRG